MPKRKLRGLKDMDDMLQTACFIFCALVLVRTIAIALSLGMSGVTVALMIIFSILISKILS